MRILITSVGTATSINLIRYFHKLNDYIVGTDINLMGYTAGSMLADAFYRVPFAVQEEQFISEITEIINTERIDLFIPINDIEVFVCAKNRDRIKCACVIPDYDVICRLRDKYICSTDMEKYGLDVPRILEKDVHEKRILRDRIGVGSKGIKILSADEKTPEFDFADKFLQKFVIGDEYTIDVMADFQGTPAYIVPRKRIEVKDGVATKVEITKIDALIERVRFLLTKIKIPGFSNFQFICDACGNFWFIEVNYRFSGCGAATLAVSDGYLNVYKEIVDGKPFTGELNSGVKWESIVTRYYEEVVYAKGFH